MLTCSTNRFSLSVLFSYHKKVFYQLVTLLISSIILFPASAQIEEIIVTAQKREQNVQDVSISITAFTGDTLQDLGVAQPRDLAQFTPGLTVNASSSYEGDSVFTIRGVGMNDVTSKQNPAVMIYLDEIALPSHVMLGFQMFDVDRIEVLKGPQGTLYGRNTTGGAIKVVPRKPTREFDLQARFDYAEYDRTELELGVGGPLGDTLSARVAANINVSQHGWQTLETIPEVPFGPGVDPDNGEIDRKAYRGSILWEPTEQFDILISGDYSEDKSEVMAFKHAGNLFADGSPGFCSYATEGIRNEVECASFAQIRDRTGGMALTPEREIIQDRNPDVRTVLGEFSTGNQVDAESWGISATVNIDFDRFTATSITGYREFDRYQPLDQGGSPAYIHEIRNWEDITSFTQEIRFASDDSWGPIDWIVGGFYSKDDNDFFSDTDFRDHASFSGFFESGSDQETEGISAFAQVDWRMHEMFKVSLGIRYTDEDREFSFSGKITGSGPVPLPLFTHPKLNTEEVGGRVALEFTPTDNLLLYASFNRGFKSGGFPASIAFSRNQLLPFQSEELLAYEAGFKSTLLDGNVRFNAAGYYYDWNDMQARAALDRIDPVSGQNVRVITLGTAGDVEIYGAEAEFTWQLTPELLVYTGVSLMDAEIQNGDYEDQTPAHAPDFTINGLASYTASQGIGGFRPFVQFDYSYTDSNQFILPNHPGAVQNSYTLLNARIGLRSDDGHWELAGWGRNLSDKEYFSEIFGPASGFLPGRLHYGPPRIFGVSISYSH